MNKRKLLQIERRIKILKSSLTETGDMRPGSLTKQYRRPSDKTGPYYQLSYTLDMKSRTEYVKKDYVKKIRSEIERYKKFKELNEEWVKLSIERSKIEMKLGNDL